MALTEKKVEFPDYCIMPGKDMALVKLAPTLGIPTNRNGCIGCGMFNCFGNPKYDKPLDEYQQKQVDNWKNYINGGSAIQKSSSDDKLYFDPRSKNIELKPTKIAGVFTMHVRSKEDE